MERLNSLIDSVNAFAWGPPMLGMLGVTGLLLTLGLVFMPWRKVGYGFRLLFDKSEAAGEGEVKPFNALMTALSATVGTGNIAGVATAIALGGPGAIFYMWLIALFGMATKYAEAVCAVTYREVDANGMHVGGPMYYLRNGVGAFAPELGKWLGLGFAVFGAVAAFGIGNAVQVNSMATALASSFGVPTWITGLIVAALVGIVVIGGIQRIGEVAGKLVPAMIVLYIGAALIVIIINITAVPAAIALIFTYAFTPAAAAGGFAGAAVAAAVRFGVARGVFSNESGLGSAAIAHAAAQTNSPVRQGVIAMLGTFIDTLVVCTMTALVILTSGAWTLTGAGRRRPHRRRADLRGLPELHARRPLYRHGGAGGVRLHHHPRVVLLRRAVLAVPVQREQPDDLSRALGAGGADLRQRQGVVRVEPVGYAQRPDGGAQPHRSALAGADGLQGDARVLRQGGEPLTSKHGVLRLRIACPPLRLG